MAEDEYQWAGITAVLILPTLEIPIMMRVCRVMTSRCRFHKHNIESEPHVQQKTEQNWQSFLLDWISDHEDPVGIAEEC